MISIKSFFKVAPVLPPPPYTWLMTTVPATEGVGMGVGVGVGVGVGGIPDAVTEKSSIANPWSFPVSSGSCHRNQISCPLFTVTVSVAVKSGGCCPSNGAGKAQRGESRPAARRSIGAGNHTGVGYLILKSKNVGGVVAAVTPLLADVTDVKRG